MCRESMGLFDATKTMVTSFAIWICATMSIQNTRTDAHSAIQSYDIPGIPSCTVSLWYRFSSYMGGFHRVRTTCAYIHHQNRSIRPWCAHAPSFECSVTISFFCLFDSFFSNVPIFLEWQWHDSYEISADPRLPSFMTNAQELKITEIREKISQKEIRNLEMDFCIICWEKGKKKHLFIFVMAFWRRKAWIYQWWDCFNAFQSEVTGEAQKFSKGNAMKYILFLEKSRPEEPPYCSS